MTVSRDSETELSSWKQLIQKCASVNDAALHLLTSVDVWCTRR